MAMRCEIKLLATAFGLMVGSHPTYSAPLNSRQPDPHAVAPGSILWREYGAGRREADEKRRPMLIVFGCNTSAWTHKYKKVSLSDKTILELISHELIPIYVELNGDEHQLANSLG